MKHPPATGSAKRGVRIRFADCRGCPIGGVTRIIERIIERLHAQYLWRNGLPGQIDQVAVVREQDHLGVLG